jgi:uncharacterized membrane protein YphA (DoxX/SURF4 family)
MNLAPDEEPRNSVSDWMIRIGVAAFYLVSGLEKFFRAESHWRYLFNEIGFGTWFRYFAGVVEIVGAGLALIPQTEPVGLALLAAMMGSAFLILAVRVDVQATAFYRVCFASCSPCSRAIDGGVPWKSRSLFPRNNC